MALGQNILELRKKRGFSQEKLGEKIGVSRQTISNWELGETSPNYEQLKALSKLLNISVDKLIDNNLENDVFSDDKITKKIFKVLFIVFIIFLVVDIITLIICYNLKIGPF